MRFIRGDDEGEGSGWNESYIFMMYDRILSMLHHFPIIPFKTSACASALASFNFNSSLSLLIAANASSNSVTRSTFLCRYLRAASVFFCRFCILVGSAGEFPLEDGESRLRFVALPDVDVGVAVVGRVDEEEDVVGRVERKESPC
jgi:hypothetical protein